MKTFLRCMASCMMLCVASMPVSAQSNGTNAGTNKPTVRVETIATKAGSSFTVEHVEGIDPRYEGLIKRLVGDGWEEPFVRACFSDSHTVFIPKLTVIGPKKKISSKGWYTWVNTAESAQACRDFMAKYGTIIQAAETKYGVDKEVIAALIRCETQHGTVTGNYHVFSAYASTALVSDSEYLNRNISNGTDGYGETKSGKRQAASQEEYIRARSAKKSSWAYRELKNLLQMEKGGHVQMLSIYGSWAGAFGWGQFLPSSYLSRAVDGNGDTQIDLYNPDDAIFSVANYLDKAGFKTGNPESIKRALRNYNNSTDYVNAIYGLAQRLKTTEG
ncbi:MAG: lytic murein transglycosylase [Chlorobi bacterium]|nr:lytic murein transglycosylase [Chlorobiota bacterium]